MKHHVRAAESPSGPRDVVLVDEEIRVCGERSTTSHRRRRIGIQRLGAKETKEQGFAGVFAPSPKGWNSEKVQRLGAKETKEQGFAGIRAPMLMYGKEASNRKQEIDRQHYTIPNQRPKDKHCGKI